MRSGQPTLVLPLLILAAVGGLWLLGDGGDRRGDPAVPAQNVRQSTVEVPALSGSARTPEPSQAGTDPRPGSEETEPPRQEAPLPPGILEILVLLEEAPMPGAAVEATRERDTPEDVQDEVRDATSAHGRVRFIGLRPGDWHVDITAPPDFAARSFVDLHEGQGSQLVVRFGTGGMRGHVWDERGSPLSGSLILVGATFQTFRVEALSAADGSWSVTGLLPGRYWIQEHPPRLRQPPWTREARRRVVDLRAGEVKTVDLGAADPPAAWSGRLLLADGSPLESSLSLDLASADGWMQSIGTDERGRFRAELVPGRYTVLGRMWDGNRELDQLDIDRRDLARDLVLPGACIEGRVAYRGTLRDPAQALLAVFVWLQPEAERSPKQHVALESGEYCFLGVVPGRYRLSTTPGQLASHPADGLPVIVTEGVARVTLDLVVTDP